MASVRMHHFLRSAASRLFFIVVLIFTPRPRPYVEYQNTCTVLVSSKPLSAPFACRKASPDDFIHMA